MPKRVYSKEEADAILSRAIELQGRGDSTSHEDLVAAGREVGVSQEAVERAAEEWASKRRDEQAAREIRARSWRGFYAHLVPYALVNMLLAFVNTLTGGPPWVLFVTLGWGIGLGSHLLAVANPDPRKMQRRVERERRRAAAEERSAFRTVRVEAFVEPARVRADNVSDDEAELDGVSAEPGARGRR